MAYFRNDTAALHTGVALETTEGTSATISSANFVGDWDAGLIVPKYTVNNVKCGGSVGTDKLVTGKVYGELASLKVPFSNSVGTLSLKALGAFYTSGATSTYDIGGSVYSGITGTNKGRISTNTLTFVQYDGREQYVIYGAKPSSLKLGAKSGEVITMEAAYQGSFYKTNSSISYFQTPTSFRNFNLSLGAALSINGVTYDYSDVEIDFKPTMKPIESAASASGYAGFEIEDINPEIAVTLYPGDPTAADLWTMLAANTPVTFSWTFGSGVGNSYVVSALVQMNSQDSSYDNNTQVRKIVFMPAFNSALPYKMRIAIS